uniref:Uncharacterized protein n=1 Tax=Rhizophora mucronata TaxID=61149 RepID=A0A2P2Q7Y2_RHIMU
MSSLGMGWITINWSNHRA